MHTGYRIQEAILDTSDLLNPELQHSHVWGSGNEDEGDPRTRHGISACESLEALAAYLAGPGSGIPYGSGEWVIVEMAGPVSGDNALDAEDGEFLILPERIVSVRPLDDEFFDMIGAAYDALTD
ncbi:hypothetical protein [Salana multivorans]